MILFIRRAVTGIPSVSAVSHDNSKGQVFGEKTRCSLDKGRARSPGAQSSIVRPDEGPSYQLDHRGSVTRGRFFGCDALERTTVDIMKRRRQIQVQLNGFGHTQVQVVLQCKCPKSQSCMFLLIIAAYLAVPRKAEAEGSTCMSRSYCS